MKHLTDLIVRLRADFKMERLTGIVDVGSNPFGDPPYESLLRANAARVTGFEPQAAAFERLKDRQTEFEQHLPYAVGDGSDGTLNVCRNSGFTSLLMPNAKTMQFLGKWKRETTVVESIPMQTKRLDDMDEITALDLLKIDVQGGELAVFQSARKKLRDAVMIVTEAAFIPLYENQPLISDQMTELAGQGFMLHRFMDWRRLCLRRPGINTTKMRMNANQLTDIDAVFIRDMTNPDTLSDDQLMQLALLAVGAIQSFDLAVAAVWELEQRGVVTSSTREAVLDYCRATQGVANG